MIKLKSRLTITLFAAAFCFILNSEANEQSIFHLHTSTRIFHNNTIYNGNVELGYGNNVYVKKGKQKTLKWHGGTSFSALSFVLYTKKTDNEYECLMPTPLPISIKDKRIDVSWYLSNHNKMLHAKVIITRAGKSQPDKPRYYKCPLNE